MKNELLERMYHISFFVAMFAVTIMCVSLYFFRPDAPCTPPACQTTCAHPMCCPVPCAVAVLLLVVSVFLALCRCWPSKKRTSEADESDKGSKT